jgi:hypothetical protein
MSRNGWPRKVVFSVFRCKPNRSESQQKFQIEVVIGYVDEAIHAAEEGITEGRAAIRDLRPEPAVQRDLPDLLNTAFRELATAHELNGHAPSYQVLVEGEKQELSPMLQSEVYRISREVIRNAFAHAAASCIELESPFNPQQLGLPRLERATTRLCPKAS